MLPEGGSGSGFGGGRERGLFCLSREQPTLLMEGVPRPMVPRGGSRKEEGRGERVGTKVAGQPRARRRRGRRREQLIDGASEEGAETEMISGGEEESDGDWDDTGRGRRKRRTCVGSWRR